MPYQWDSVPSYRLHYTTVNQFLMELFGNYDFYTQVRSRPALHAARRLMLTAAPPDLQRPHPVLDPQSPDRCKTGPPHVCKPR
jgi:hypothetical protein